MCTCFPPGEFRSLDVSLVLGTLFVCRILTTSVTEFNVKYVAESSDSVIKDTAPL